MYYFLLRVLILLGQIIQQGLHLISLNLCFPECLLRILPNQLPYLTLLTDLTFLAIFSLLVFGLCFWLIYYLTVFFVSTGVGFLVFISFIIFGIILFLWLTIFLIFSTLLICCGITLLLIRLFGDRAVLGWTRRRLLVSIILPFLTLFNLSLILAPRFLITLLIIFLVLVIRALFLARLVAAHIGSETGAFDR